MSTLGGPILLKQGYMQRKGMMGWKRQYYRLLQDSLFQFTSHDSKTPTDEVTLMGGGVEDGSWNAKRANCLQISTERGKREFFLCDNSDEHKQWFDAVYYATTVSKLAEYCSPLSGGWLHFYEGKTWIRRWFVVKDSFMLCYNSREDVNPATTSGAPVNRRFVLPLGGSVIAYHKTVMPFSFSVQIFSAGELKNEFILAAASEPIMNVWMEVLYVSTGKELPGLEDEEGAVALDVDTKLDEINSGATPQPSRRHRDFTHGKGLDLSEAPQMGTHGLDELDEPVLPNHGAKAPPEKKKSTKDTQQDIFTAGLGGLGMGQGPSTDFGGGLPATFGDLGGAAAAAAMASRKASSVGGLNDRPASALASGAGGLGDSWTWGGGKGGGGVGGIRMPWDVDDGSKKDGCHQQ